VLISHLLIHHKTPGPRFAPGLFIGLIATFSLLGQSKPVFALAGLGTTLIAGGSLIELNRQRIWENYRKGLRKAKGLKGIWTKPNTTYYTINVVFLWPFIIFLGMVCLWASYVLSSS
jgi:hypothetical protein